MKHHPYTSKAGLCVKLISFCVEWITGVWVCSDWLLMLLDTCVSMLGGGGFSRCEGLKMFFNWGSEARWGPSRKHMCLCFFYRCCSPIRSVPCPPPHCCSTQFKPQKLCLFPDSPKRALASGWECLWGPACPAVLSTTSRASSPIHRSVSAFPPSLSLVCYTWTSVRCPLL